MKFQDPQKHTPTSTELSFPPAVERAMLQGWTRGEPVQHEILRGLLQVDGRVPCSDEQIRDCLVRIILRDGIGALRTDRGPRTQLLTTHSHADCIAALHMLQRRGERSHEALAGIAHRLGALREPSLDVSQAAITTLHTLNNQVGLLFMYALTFLPEVSDKRLGLRGLEVVSARLYFARSYEMFLEGDSPASYRTEIATSVNQMIEGYNKIMDEKAPNRRLHVPLLESEFHTRVPPERSRFVAELSGVDVPTEKFHREALDAARIMQSNALPDRAERLRALGARNAELGLLAAAYFKAGTNMCIPRIDSYIADFAPEVGRALGIESGKKVAATLRR